MEMQPTIPVIDDALRRRISRPLAMIPQSIYIMTAAHENRTASLMVSWVQQASFEPPMVVVALRKGRAIVPLIHSSHSFALNQVAAEDKLLLRKYSGQYGIEDPLQTLEVLRKATGSPILARCATYMDCELVRHLDVEGDHDIYVGLVRDAGVLREGADIDVHLREDGFTY
jgi:flavin reductase (DIM6/NTAB) family NADH-FMN oxidoreductase RutF